MTIFDGDTGEILEVAMAPASSMQQHEGAAMQALMLASKAGRSIKQFQADLEAWSCHSQSIAQSCTYVLRKGGSRITGPSIRFAELLQAAYRWIDVDAFIEEEAEKYVVVAACATDLARGIRRRARIRRNITTSEGNRYSADMIQQTIQAATSIAIRNSIIAVIPRALWEDVWQLSRDVSQGKDEHGKAVRPFSERIKAAFDFLGSLGATPDQVLAYLQKPSVKDLDGADLEELQLKARAIRNGEVDVDKAFPVPEKEKPQRGAASSAAATERLAQAAAERTTQRETAAKPAKEKKSKKRPVNEDAPAPARTEEAPPTDDIPSVDL